MKESQTYSYDSSDMRTSKTVGGVKHNYYYVEGKLMYEDCPSYKLFYSYDANGFLSGIKRVKSNGVTENYGVHCNIFGDVISIYFSDGSLAATYTYDTWGKLLAVTDMTGNDVMGDNEIWTQNSIRYRGYVYDEETQLYYLQSRYYDPNTGRFINADDYSVLTTTPTALTDKNLYAYCDCNPLVRTDTEGEYWNTIIGGVMGGLTGAIGAAISGDNIWVGLGVGLATGAAAGFVGDLCIATGGLAAFAISALSSGAFDAINTYATERLNGRTPQTSAIVTDFVFGTVCGALDFAMTDDAFIRSTGTINDNMLSNLKKNTIPNEKKYHGKTTKPTTTQKVVHTIKNFASDASISIVYSGGAAMFNLYATYWGK